MQIHKDLEVWQKAVDFVTEVYGVTQSFPKEEVYGITSQIRRAAVSVPSNIAEDAARKSNKEYIRFLYIALGSLMEVDTQLLISFNLKYIGQLKYKELEQNISEIGRLLNGLIRHRKELEDKGLGNGN